MEYNPFAALRNNVGSQHKLRIPDFYVGKPRLWFIQLEAQFNLANVFDDNSKFFHVIASLPAEVASRVDFIIENPPNNNNRYFILKEALLKAYEKSSLELCAQALTMASLGDRSPSQLMSDLMDLIPRDHKSVICPFVVALFVEKLPSDIRLGLNIDNIESYELLAAQADALMARRLKSSNQINNVQGVNQQIQDGMEEDLEINNVNRFKKKFGKRKSEDKPAQAKYQNQNNSDKCWYHEKFGNNATKCVKPCIFFNDSKN